MPSPPEPPPLSPDLVAKPAAPAAPAPAPQVAAPPPPPPPTPAPVVVRAPEPASAPAQSCKDKVTAAVDGRVVLFKRSSAVIDDASAPLLRAIATALKDCGSLSVAIEGHADNEGAQFNNQRLSEARAAAVASALKEAGASDARLTSAGFGFSKPLVPNTSADNKAKNRRVEFIIR
jgi:outer membrane protein OmpA-like peptidoglycan-associated protein